MIVEELKSLPPFKLEEAAGYIEPGGGKKNRKEL
jgi:hypothetical protein